MSRGCHLALALAVGCTLPKTPKPEGTTARIGWSRSASEHELRYAVAWVEQEPLRVWVSDEGPVTGSSFAVQLDLPPGVRFERLAPSESIQLFDGNSYVAAPNRYVEGAPLVARGYRPRIVVYEDLDDDGRFDITDAETSDRILARDGAVGVAALADPEGAMGDMAIDQARRFYEVNGRYTRFVFVTEYAGQLYMQERQPLGLLSLRPVSQREHLLCARGLADSADERIFSVVIERGLAVDVPCDDEDVSCATETLVDIDPPARESAPNVERFEQCLSHGAVESFVVFESSEQCQNCACRDVTRTTVHIAARSDLPPWWPCGDTVQRCTDAGSLVEFDLECFLRPDGRTTPRPDSGVNDQARDAGPHGPDAGARDTGR